MDTALITAIVGITASISGIALGWAGRARSIRQEDRQQAGDGAKMHTDMEYIKRGVDDIRLEQRAQGQRIDALTERVVRVEESSKQAHKRLDRLGTRERED